MSRKTVTLVQMNDTHAYLTVHPELLWERGQAVYRPAGGYARIATLVKEMRAASKESLLFCDNGDTLHGTYAAVATQGKALVPVLNALGLAATTGHWEFAYGPATFKQRAGELAYPVLAANVYHEATGDAFFPSYVLQEVAGLRLGIVGIASNIVDKTMPPSFSEGLRFTLGREELPAIIERLRGEEKVNLVVLVLHLGFPQDMKLVAEVPGVDVVFSGHTHIRLFQPARQGQTLLVQSGSRGSFLTRLDLVVDGRHIVDYRHAMLEVAADIPPDGAVDSLVREALAPYTSDLAEVVGETLTPLNRNTMLEATMDNLLLQALLTSTGARLAFSNGWRYGAPVPPGPVTLNDLYNIVPMNPEVTTVELTGSELVAMLEENLEHTFAADQYHQMGGYVKRALGLTVYFKVEHPAGQRIHKVFVGDEEMRPEATYTAAFVTEQGVPRKYGQRRERHSVRAVDAMRALLQAQRPLRAELRGTYVPI